MGLNRVLREFEEIEKVSGRNAKAVRLQSLYDDPIDRLILSQLFFNTFDMYTRFHVRPSLDWFSTDHWHWLDDKEADELWAKFHMLLERLAKGEVPLARQVVHQLLTHLHHPYRKWFCKIMWKDLECGVSYGTVNDFFPDLLSGFGVQLCNDWQGGELEGEYIIEPKLKGVRCIMMQNGGGEWIVLSRNGRPLWNCDHILEQIAERMQGSVLDGEVYIGTSPSPAAQQRVLSIVKTQYERPDADQVVFHCFDMISKVDWLAQRFTDPLTDRKLYLQLMTEDLVAPNFVVVPYKTVKDAAEAELATRFFVELGWEGSVMKRTDSFYTFKRNDNWLKHKIGVHKDVKIVGVQEGTGRLQGTLGALLIEYDNLRSKVGTGFADFERDRMWQLYQEGKLVGMMCEVVFYEKTAKSLLEIPVFAELKEEV